MTKRRQLILLVSYPQHEPAVFVRRNDAGLLRQALTAAFGSSIDELSRGENGNSKLTGAVVPGHGVLHGERGQP